MSETSATQYLGRGRNGSKITSGSRLGTFHFLRFPFAYLAIPVLFFGSHLSDCLADPAPDNVVPLAGEWRFALDRSAEQTVVNPPRPLPEGESLTQKWFERDLPDHIQLPGILQAQDYGDDISPTTPWMVDLGDAWWKLQPVGLREHFSKPGHVEVPFLSQPPKHYLGVAWYQRDIEIPDNWQKRRVELFLERAHWETTVWVDDKCCSSDDSLVSPHVHELGVLSTGRHRLSIRIDNRRLVMDEPFDGHAISSHAVSDALGAAWNGVVGRIELISTTPVWIDDAQAFPNVATKSALIKVKIGNITGLPGSGTLSAGDQSVPVKWTADGGEAELSVPLGKDAKLWDEFHPNLQHLTVTLAGDNADDSRSLSFGLREITTRGTELILNGRSVNLRMTHSGGDFPLTGYPAMDVESWKKIIKVCQDYGMNGIRFHSWCPPEAAFTAADEMGFYLQPEWMWVPFNVGSVYSQMLEGETARMLKAFGNHPSFLLLSPGNEPGGHELAVLPQWAQRWHERDPRRLYSGGANGPNPPGDSGGAQYLVLAYNGKKNIRNPAGWFGKDFDEQMSGLNIPVLTHEMGQWVSYPNFDIIKEFTGYLRPGNYEIFKYLAAQQGTLKYDKAFAQASGRFQVECYKEAIEANLRTHSSAGYQLLDLHDYLGQGTALVGVLDAFWKPKGYVTGEEFRRFNGVTVPLARLSQRTFTTKDHLICPVELYNFAENPISGAKPYWKINDAYGNAVAHGEGPEREIPIGKGTPLFNISTDLSQIKAPGAYRLVVGIEGTTVVNDWNFWVYPAQDEGTVPSDVLITSDWPEAEARLSRGGKVLFTVNRNDLDAARSPAMRSLPVYWDIQMSCHPPKNPLPKFDGFLGLLCDTKHPALAEFPTDTYCDWQWTPLVNGVKAINLSTAPPELTPIVSAIDDYDRNWRLAAIFECKVGLGRLVVSAIPFDQSPSPGALQLRRSLLDYMAGKSFNPPVGMSPEQLKSLFQRKGAPAPEHRVFDPDLNL